MPCLQTILKEELGPSWRQSFSSFEETPVAAASIGQVHRATLPDGSQVAVKIQFPGIAQSIDSDIGYLKSLLTISFMLPPGLFLDNSLRVLSRELHEECDYGREAGACTQFQQLLRSDPSFSVPSIKAVLSTQRILTMDYMQGTPLKALQSASQAIRDHVSSH